MHKPKAILETRAAILVVVVTLGLGQSLRATMRTVPGGHATIQGCIDASANGDSCSVSPGTYNEAIDFLGKAIVVRSTGGPDITTIDAVGLGASVVTFANGEVTTSVLQGFTITGGVGTTSSGFKFGGGLYISGASPTINSCIITANTATGAVGGGVYSVGGSAELTDCTISNNSANSAGGMLAFGGGPTLIDCDFINNNNGGYKNDNASSTLINCTFTGNTASIGGGMSTKADVGVTSFATLTGCVFNNNTASLWGGWDEQFR